MCDFMAEDHYDDYYKWKKWAFEQRYGEGSWDGRTRTGVDAIPGLANYSSNLIQYWDEQNGIGVIQRDGKNVGIACLVAKEVTDRESYIRRFGLSFEKDIQWRAVSGILDHLSRTPLFKAVLVTTSDLPFTLESDIPEKLEGRRNWANRNYEFHKNKAEKVKRDLKGQQGTFGGPFPKFLPKQMKEEEDYARKFMNSVKTLESQMQDFLKPYFIIKEKLFAAALFFYVYTTPKDNLRDCVDEIKRRKYSAKMEISKTYFVRCSDVKDPVIVFNPELYPFFPEHKKYFGLALAADAAGFNSDKDIGIGLRKMFTTALNLPTEESIEERIHIPTKEVSVEGSKNAFLGYVIRSVVKKQVTKSRVYFPLDVLTSHAIIFGKTRTGKSFFSLILIKEALEKDVEVIVFDPHGTLSDRLRDHRNLSIVLTHGRADITDRLQKIFNDVSDWPETNQLKRLVVLDETRLLRAKNLVYCINELGKRGVGFVLITQYSTSIPPEIRNVGTYFIMGAMSETEIKRFKEVTLHPSSKLIGRLPRASSFVYSPYWYPEPFFIKHRKIKDSMI